MFGVTSTGFVRKRQDVILADIEARISAGNPGLDQGADTPIGQMNGAFSEVIAELWEVAEATYQSRDPNQAEDGELDVLGSSRNAVRASGEADESYRRRITNVGVSNFQTADIENRLRAIDGVAYARVIENDSNCSSIGIPPTSVAAYVSGGDDLAVAEALVEVIAPGITAIGTTLVSVPASGCAPVKFTRLIDKSVTLIIDAVQSQSACGCAPPDNVAAFEKIKSAFSQDEGCGLVNGDTLTSNRVIAALGGLVAEGLDVTAVLARVDDGDTKPLPLSFALSELPIIAAVELNYA